jgi:hypothetical protein
MSRPKKQPSLENQMESIVMQAMAEKRWDLATTLIDLLRDFSAQKKVEEKNGNTSQV